MAGRAQEHEVAALNVVIVGDNGTGKTALCRCLAGQQYAPVTGTTLGIEVEFHLGDVIDASGQRTSCRFNLHDCGQTMREARFAYYKRCSAALVVYDTTRRSTFASLTTWLDELFEGCFPPEGVIIIVGTKQDCVETRQVSLEESHDFARENSTLHQEVSAKTGENMEALSAVINNMSLAVDINTERTPEMFECYRKGERWLSRTTSKFPWSTPDFEVHQLSQNILGCGTFGVIYRAQYLGTDVAAKVHRAMLHPEEYDLANAVERRHVLHGLVAELRALTRIKHQHVIDFIAIAYSSEVVVGSKLPIWIITALADCGSIYDAIHHKDQALSGLHAQELTRQVAYGLHYLHGRGLVHRDVKSKNLLVMSDGRVVIADLGLAKLCRRLPDLYANSGTDCGSPPYIGPEGAQATSSSRDMYALGCVLCEAVLREDLDRDRREEQIIEATRSLDLQGLHIVKGVMQGLLESEPEARPSASTVMDAMWDPSALLAWVAMVVMQHRGKARAVEDCFRQLTSICHRHPTADSHIQLLCGVVRVNLLGRDRHAGILLESVRLLVELLGNTEADARACCHYLDEHGVICQVIMALRNHPRDAALSGACAALLADFCQALRGEEGGHKERIVDANGLSGALAMLATHVDHSAVQEHGYRFLAELCHGVQDGIAETCRQGLAKGRVVRGLVKALQRHAQHVGVQRAGIACLVNVCRGEDSHLFERRQMVCRSDALLVVVSAAQLHQDRPEIQAGCDELISELASETDEAFLQALQCKLSTVRGMLRAWTGLARSPPTGGGGRSGPTRRSGCYRMLARSRSCVQAAQAAQAAQAVQAVQPPHEGRPPWTELVAHFAA